MRKLAVLASILLGSAAAFGQAMAEGALTHALSTATGTAMGKALGTATNQMTSRVAGRLGQQTSPAVPRSKIQTVRPGVQKSAAVPPSGTTAEPPAGGSLIASIQGAAPQETATPCAPVVQTPSAASPANAQAVPEQKQSDCPAKGSAPAGGKDQANSYQSVITLPAAK